MRFPRFIPPAALVPFTAPAGHLYCQNCQSWKRFDVYPGVQSHGLPDFKICCFCGVWIDEPAEEAS